MAEELTPSVGWQIADALTAVVDSGRSRQASGIATVSGADSEGRVWVHLPGSVNDTPVNGSSVADCEPGQSVSYTIANGRLSITGNASNPSVGQENVDRTIAPVSLRMDAIGEIANTAKEAADAAVFDASRANEAASSAQSSANSAAVAAGNAQSSANAAAAAAGSAQASADNASEYAARALGNLSTVQSVAETLAWITQHGTMALTADTEPDPTHVYFVADAGGDYVVGSAHYSLVIEPVAADMATYYELTIDESLNNYVGTHLALTAEGLWLLPASSGAYRILIATGAGTTYTEAGTYIIDANGNSVAKFGASGTRIGDASSERVEISSSGVDVYLDETTHAANFGTDGLELYADGVSVAQFGETARIGRTNHTNVQISASGFSIRNNTNSKMFEVISNGVTSQVIANYEQVVDSTGTMTGWPVVISRVHGDPASTSGTMTVECLKPDEVDSFAFRMRLVDRYTEHWTNPPKEDEVVEKDLVTDFGFVEFGVHPTGSYYTGKIRDTIIEYSYASGTLSLVLKSNLEVPDDEDEPGYTVTHNYRLQINLFYFTKANYKEVKESSFSYGVHNSGSVGPRSAVMGSYLTAIGRDSLAIGHFNDEPEGSGGYPFSIGNGTSNHRTNALTVDWDGRVDASEVGVAHVDIVKDSSRSDANAIRVNNGTNNVYIIDWDGNIGTRNSSHAGTERPASGASNITLHNWASYDSNGDGIGYSQIVLASNRTYRSFAVTNRVTGDALGLYLNNYDDGGMTLSLTSGATIAAAAIPSLAASKIGSGTLDAARIPTLDASKIGTGELNSARIPSLAASKIGSGTFDAARIPTLAIGTKTSGTLAVSRGGTGVTAKQASTVTLSSSTASKNYCWHNGVLATVTLGALHLSSALASSSNRKVGSVPSGYRPADTVYAIGSANTDGTTGKVFIAIASDGEITLYNRTGASLATSTNMYFTVTYAI